MPQTLPQLIDVLTLEQLDADRYIGSSPATALQRVYGGQVLGQALMAVGRSVDVSRHVHSLHAYFIRPGLIDTPIAYTVEEVREGHSFSTRRVVATQGDRMIFFMSASFHGLESGFEHQREAPQVEGPEGLASLVEIARRLPQAWPVDPIEWAAIDVRPIPPPPRSPLLRAWLRADGDLPDDPLLHAAVLAYASDLTLLSVAAQPHGVRLSDPSMVSASLDHAMWFHRPFRADRWLLHDEMSPSASNSRGLAQGWVYAADGTLVATTVQEGLMRQRTR